MKPNLNVTAFVSIGLALLCGCKSTSTSPTLPTVPLATLLSSPTQIQLGGRSFALETYLWRDFMPISPPDGKPLTALVKIKPSDTLPFPANITAVKLWIILQDSTTFWETDFSTETVPFDSNKLCKIARGGPKYGPDIYVEVVVKLNNSSDNSVAYLRATKQYIYRTD